MKRWLTGIRGAVVMILTWTVGWGLGFGGLIEAFVDPSGAIIDIWFTAMAIPGFLGGVLFSALLRLTEGGRGFHELPLLRCAGWGALTGLVLGGLALVTVLAQAPALAATGMVALAMALGAVAGVGSARFFRLVARGQGISGGMASA